jgi:hypothetical protein
VCVVSGEARLLFCSCACAVPNQSTQRAARRRGTRSCSLYISDPTFFEILDLDARGERREFFFIISGRHCDLFRNSQGFCCQDDGDMYVHVMIQIYGVVCAI